MSTKQARSATGANTRRDKAGDRARDKAMGHRLQRMRSQSHVDSHDSDGMAAFDRRDVSLDCGWGRLIFAQTFSNRTALVDALVEDQLAARRGKSAQLQPAVAAGEEGKKGRRAVHPPAVEPARDCCIAVTR